jgi:NitT/TauT family transport system permease protein
MKLRTIRLESVIEKVLAIGLLLLAWELCPRLGLIDVRFLPPFSDVIKGLIELTASGQMALHMEASLRRSLLGFIIAVLMALPLGIIMGWFKRFEKVVDPLLQVCRNTSVLALYPVFILIFGLSEFSKIAIIFWGTLWPILLNTIEGVKGVDPLLIKSARSMGSSQLTLLLKVVVPFAMPLILTGLRLGASRSVVVLVAAEMLGAQEGLGFLIFQTQLDHDNPEMYAGIISIALLGVLINYGLAKLEQHLIRWKE